jgi:hypothetical protein
MCRRVSKSKINSSSFEFSCVAFSRLEMCVLVSPLFVSKQTYPLGLPKDRDVVSLWVVINRVNIHTMEYLLAR